MLLPCVAGVPQLVHNVPVASEKAGTISPRATFSQVFAQREFRALWLSQVLSVAGDRLALVAITLLVYERTNSALLTAAAYAAGFVPWVAGGVAFARLADRLPRREVMIACDLARMVLVAGMTVPAEPLPVLVGLLFVATCFAPPFEAARAATVPDILPGDQYVLATAVVQTTYRAGMVAGYAVGGAVVAAIGARASLAADAVTFALSAVLVRYGVRRRAGGGPARRGSALADITAGVRFIFSDRQLRTLMLLGWLVAFYAVPEGIAAPYAHQHGGGPVAVGLVLAAEAAGGVAAAPIFARLFSPERRLQLMGPLAVGACAILVACVAQPSLPASLGIFVLAGACGVYQIAANAAFITAVPSNRRAQAFGLANAGLIVGQGIAFVLAGAAAEAISPPFVVACAGAVGAVAGAALTAAWRRTTPPPESARR